MTERLRKALDKLARMSHPSAAGLLKKYKYDYEAEAVEEVVQAFEEDQKAHHKRRKQCGDSSSGSSSQA